MVMKGLVLSHLRFPLVSFASIAFIALSVAASAGATREPAKPVPNCKALLPQSTIEATLGVKVQPLAYHQGQPEFAAVTGSKGTKQTCSDGYAPTRAENGYPKAAELRAGFQETPKQWTDYQSSTEALDKRESQRSVSISTGPVGLPGKYQGFFAKYEFHSEDPELKEPYWSLVVYTPGHNIFVMALCPVFGATSKASLSVERKLALKVGTKLDQEWRAANHG